MAALVCDLCGGKLVMGAGGIAVCDSCGMQHSPARMNEKIQEIKGTVRVDSSHMVGNWMKMGNAAAEAGNNKEAYEYFTKVIEVDPENWRAIYEKGKAGAWQSTLSNERTPELYQGIKMALEIIERTDMSEDDRSHLKNEFSVALFNINNAITDLISDNLTELDDVYFDAHLSQMVKMHQRHLKNVTLLEDAASLIAEQNDNLSKDNIIEFKKRMCYDLRSACRAIQYWTDYSKDSLAYFGFSASEKKPYLDKYWGLVEEIRLVEPEYATDKYSYPDPFDPGLNLSEECYKYWKDTDNKRQELMKQEQQKKRFDEYWSLHAAKKNSLEAERQLLYAQIEEINDEKLRNTHYDEIKRLNDRIKKLTSDKASLGMFKGKEKREIQIQIDQVTAELRMVSDRVQIENRAIQDSLFPLQNRINTIEAELTRER